MVNVRHDNGLLTLMEHEIELDNGLTRENNFDG